MSLETCWWPADLPSFWVHHVWFIQSRGYEKSGSTAPAGGRAQSVRWRFPRQLQIWNSSVCRMLNMTLCWLEYLQVRIPSGPRRSVPFFFFGLFLFVVRRILTRFSKPLFINQWIFKGKPNLKPVQKPLCNVLYYTNFYFCKSLMSTSEFSVSQG